MRNFAFMFFILLLGCSSESDLDLSAADLGEKGEPLFFSGTSLWAGYFSPSSNTNGVLEQQVPELVRKGRSSEAFELLIDGKVIYLFNQSRTFLAVGELQLGSSMRIESELSIYRKFENQSPLLAQDQYRAEFYEWILDLDEEEMYLKASIYNNKYMIGTFREDSKKIYPLPRGLEEEYVYEGGFNLTQLGLADPFLGVAREKQLDIERYTCSRARVGSLSCKSSLSYKTENSQILLSYTRDLHDYHANSSLPFEDILGLPVVQSVQGDITVSEEGSGHKYFVKIDLPIGQLNSLKEFERYHGVGWSPITQSSRFRESTYYAPHSFVPSESVDAMRFIIFNENRKKALVF